MICFADGDTLYETILTAEMFRIDSCRRNMDCCGRKIQAVGFMAVAGLAYTGDARWSNYTVEADAHVTDMGTGIDGYNAIGFTVDLTTI